MTQASDCAAVAAATSAPWVPHPRAAGAQIQYLEGHPGQAGPFIYRLRFASGLRLPAHVHDAPLHATVLCGELLLWFDHAAEPQRQGPGSVRWVKTGEVHAEGADVDSIAQVSGTGPVATLPPPAP